MDFTPPGKAFPYRLWPMKRWRVVWVSKGAGVHGAPRCRGGARMGCLRARISMMIIAAPQSGQTKVGWTALSDASASVLMGSVLAGATCSKLAHSRKIIAAPGIGEQPIVADAVKAAGQNVQQEAAHELVGSERHGFMTGLALGPVIFPAEGDTALVQGNQA